MLEHYYNIVVDDIKNLENDYIIKCLDNYYYFAFFTREVSLINDLYNIEQELKTKININNEMIYNINNKLLTNINGNNYFLMKIYNIKKIIDLEDIVEFSRIAKLNNNLNYKNRWGTLWKTKIDYIEKQLQEMFIEKEIVYSIDYYIGLAENAIAILNKYKNNLYNDNVVLSHKRLYYPEYSFDFFNPNNYIFDLEIRDIAEYLKSMFFEGEDSFFELKNYLLSKKLTNYSYNMLFIRLIYPSYYFDEYDAIVNKNKENKKILSIIQKSREYEEFLKKAYYEISQYALLEKIDWLIY